MLSKKLSRKETALRPGFVAEADAAPSRPRIDAELPEALTELATDEGVVGPSRSWLVGAGAAQPVRR